MPELPEVETIRRQLARTWESRTIKKVVTSKNNYFFVTPPQTLQKRLVGRKAHRLDRIGKYIVARLDDESRLLLHLGMTGQFVARSLPPDEHLHVTLHLSGRHFISLRDVRKFGKIEWIAPGKTSPRLEKLGPDALTFDGDRLSTALKKRRIPIKTALLDQGIWAGVGNIYADEALFRTNIRPTRAANRLTKKDARLLHDATTQLLREAIDAGGSTINDYVKPDGELGGYQNFHLVYGRTGHPCSNCGATIQRKVIGGRSSHYCPQCQR